TRLRSSCLFCRPLRPTPRHPRPAPSPYTTLFRSHSLADMETALSTIRPVFYVSDGTGITAETIGHSLLTQFSGTRFQTNRIPFRSEEHTSELQSRENLVCRLLLEKKTSRQPANYR